MRLGSMAPATGILFVLLLIPAFVLAPYPPEAAKSTADEVVSHYADNGGAIMAGSVLSTLAVVALVFFAAVARERMVGAGAGASATAMFGGALTYAIAITIDAVLNFGAADAADELDGQIIQTMGAIVTYNFFPYALGGMIFLIGFGAAVLRHGVLPSWMGWVTLPAAVITITPLYYVGGAVAALLIVTASVIWLREAREPQAAPATA